MGLNWEPGDKKKLIFYFKSKPLKKVSINIFYFLFPFCSPELVMLHVKNITVIQPDLLYTLDHPRWIIQSKRISSGCYSNAWKRRIAVRCNQNARNGRRLSRGGVRAAAPCNHERARRGRRAQPRGTGTVSGLTERDESAAESVMPFSRQP